MKNGQVPSGPVNKMYRPKSVPALTKVPKTLVGKTPDS